MDIALTGHRPHRLDGYELSTPFYNRLRQRLRTILLECAASHEVVTVHSGMALGADTLWAEVALDLQDELGPDRVRLVAHVPFPDQTSRWGRSDQQRWRDIIDRADRTITYADRFSGAAMQARNQGMVDACDRLVAVWDGQHSGGTWNTVHYARDHGVATTTIDPDSLR